MIQMIRRSRPPRMFSKRRSMACGRHKMGLDQVAVATWLYWRGTPPIRECVMTQFHVMLLRSRFPRSVRNLLATPTLLAVTIIMVGGCLSRNASGEVTGIKLLPETVTFSGPGDVHRVTAQLINSEQVGRSVTAETTLSSDAEHVVEIIDGKLVPRGNGAAVVTGTYAGKQASIQVTVSGFEEPKPVTFRNHVEPILTRMSCNSGACHGALAGKGGFRLSLRGYDPFSDYHAITQQARGRRIELADPARSLILAKPTGAIPHKGGVRFEPDSANYRILAEWIASGASAPSELDAQVLSIQVLPERISLASGDVQPLIVQATYSDGRVEDVTHWSQYSSTNEAVLMVDEEGNVTIVGHGEGAVVAYFSSQIGLAKMTSPYPLERKVEDYADAPSRNFIDRLVTEQLQRLNLLPSPRANDSEFIRRAFIDTIGTLPTADEVRKFLTDERKDKRDRLIDELLAREDFADYWSYRWSDLLLVSGTRLRPLSVEAFYKWIHAHVEQNTPWDQFVRAIVTARGSSHENGATNFFALHQTPEDMTENTSQAFLGLSLACAKCHNHPLEKWTNDQYYAMANMFARVRGKGWGGDSRNGDGLRTLIVADQGDLIQPLTGKPQPPATLDGDPIDIDSPEDRRVHLARWLTSPENPYFTRSITNRIWANFFGVGLVEQVDDLRVSNPASNERLLASAADFLVEHKYDLKSLMRVIMRSDTYQLSSKSSRDNDQDTRFYSRFYPRRMNSEVLLDAISQVAEVPTDFSQIEFPGADKRKTEFYPLGTRAIELYDSAVASYFLKTFGRNPRDITCDCERSNEPSLIQVLHISNGDTLNKKLQADGNRIDRWMEAGLDDERIIEEAYLTCLARFPTSREQSALLKELNADSDTDRRVLIEDLLWGIMSSREFLFNH